VVQRSEHAHRALELARAEAEGFGHRYLGPEHLVLGVQRHGDNGASALAGGTGDGEVRPEHLLLGVLEDARQPPDPGRGSRRHRRILAHVGLPEGYRGAAGLLLVELGST
jgi:ATP-dependent Clp protease ATP-binding subunit ClpC